ncbi:MAG TPA: STAS domain-containing protein [Candidatus Angelobacter sp.]|nr:STAS domain-containing protein [Candidatus Angelobacter sp.]
MAASPLPVPELELTTEKNDGATVVHGAGKITAASTDLLQTTVRRLIPDSKRIVLDLTGVEYIDSSGLGALVSVYLAAGRANCELELSNPKQRVRDLLKITKLASVFEGHAGGGL